MQGETVTVDFPEQEGWIGEVSEMELVDLGIIDSYTYTISVIHQCSLCAIPFSLLYFMYMVDLIVVKNLYFCTI